MLRISCPISSAHVAAAERAIIHLQAGLEPIRRPDGAFTVQSATSAAIYVVRVRNLGALQASCSCAHGSRAEAAGMCWHIAAVLIRETQRVGHQRRASTTTERAVRTAFPQTVIGGDR